MSKPKQNNEIAELIKTLIGGQVDPGPIALKLAAIQAREALSHFYVMALDAKNIDQKNRQRIVRGILELVHSEDAFDEAAVQTFHRLEQNEDSVIQNYLVQIYQKLGDFRSLERLVGLGVEVPVSPELKRMLALLQLFSDHRLEVREKAVEKIMALGQGGISLLLAALSQSNTDIKTAALLCLGRLSNGDDAAISAIIRFLNDNNTKIANAAAIGLSEGFFPHPNSERIVNLVKEYEKVTLNSAVKESILIGLCRSELDNIKLTKKLIPSLEEDVFHKSSNIRKFATILLEKLYVNNSGPSKQIMQQVFKGLNDGNLDVRVVSASFLSKYLSPRMDFGLFEVKSAIAKNETYVNYLLINGLRRIGTTDALAIIKDMAAHSESVTKSHALETLQNWRRIDESSGVVEAKFDED